MAVGSVDRLEEIPDRLAFLFAYDAQEALQRPAVAGVLHEPGAREVIAALADAIEGRSLDREAFRAMANRREGEDRAEGQGALPPDPRRADGRRGRTRARPAPCRRSTAARSSRRKRDCAKILSIRESAPQRLRGGCLAEVIAEPRIEGRIAS